MINHSIYEYLGKVQDCACKYGLRCCVDWRQWEPLVIVVGNDDVVCAFCEREFENWGDLWIPKVNDRIKKGLEKIEKESMLIGA